MHRSGLLVSMVLLTVLVACASNESDEPKSGFDRQMLGRWDGAVHGEDTYPLWFELTEAEDGLGGRLQPRGGHALELEEVEASGNALSMTVAERRYVGVVEDGEWEGTGAHLSGGPSFEWTAVRAPELPAPEDPTWGDPVELFNGEDLTGWVPLPGGDNQWRAEDGVLVN